MVDAARRTSVAPPAPAAAPPTLDALDHATRDRLRALAERSLDALGIHDRTPFVEDEMLRLFGELAAHVGTAPDREAALRTAIERRLAEVD